MVINVKQPTPKKGNYAQISVRAIPPVVAKSDASEVTVINLHQPGSKALTSGKPWQTFGFRTPNDYISFHRVIMLRIHSYMYMYAWGGGGGGEDQSLGCSHSSVHDDSCPRHVYEVSLGCDLILGAMVRELESLVF